jgi:hypothetical protein
MKNAFKENWFNILTLIVAIVAVTTTIRSNQIASNASTPKLEVISDSVYAYSHQLCRSQPNYHEMKLGILRSITVVNRGGRLATLLRVDFRRRPGGSTYPFFVKLSGTDPTQSLGNQILKLPLDIEAGLGRIWIVEAFTRVRSGSAEPLVESLTAAAAEILPDEQNPYQWEFEFSDGSIIITDVNVPRYSKFLEGFSGGPESDCE